MRIPLTHIQTVLGRVREAQNQSQLRGDGSLSCCSLKGIFSCMGAEICLCSFVSLLHRCRASREEHVFTWPSRQNWNQHLPGFGFYSLISLCRGFPGPGWWAGEESWRELGRGGSGYSDFLRITMLRGLSREQFLEEETA